MEKLKYLKNEKSLLDEIKKTFFIVFEGLSFGKKTIPTPSPLLCLGAT